MNVRNFLIAENEPKERFFDRFKNEPILLSNLEALNFVFSKACNNQIGYCSFITREIICRIFIVPKTITINGRSDEEIIKEFIPYMFELYRLQLKYSLEVVKLEDFSSIVAIESKTLQDLRIETLEGLAQLKYNIILDELHEFFQRHKSHSKSLKHFSSQSIKGMVSLKKNVQELNKSNIHQEKIEDIAYSQLASISFSALKLFETNKFSFTENKLNGFNVIKSQIYQLKSLLSKKFNLQNATSMTIEKLIGQKTRKIFGSKNQHVYYQLLSLFGLEALLEKENNGEICNYDVKSDSLFFQMDKLYEYAVYERICNQLQGSQHVTFKSKNAQKYRLSCWNSISNNEEFKIESIPDILIVNKNTKTIYVIDVKWKKLSAKQPALDDILKLKRDCKLRNKDGYKTIAIFIYPDICDSHLFQEYLLDDEKPSFSFYLVEMPFLSQINENMMKFELDLFEKYAFVPDVQKVK